MSVAVSVSDSYDATDDGLIHADSEPLYVREARCAYDPGHDAELAYGR